MRTPLTLAEANLRVQPLVGLPVSLPWKSDGSAAYLELGILAPLRPRQNHNDGEACIFLGYEWRVEEGSKVLYGSSDSRPTMERRLESLRGVVVQKLLIHDRVPELLIHFSNGQRLVTSTMSADGPDWDIRLPDTSWLTCGRGVVYIGDGAGTGYTPEEQEHNERADQTAKRWGVPLAHPNKGSCMNCSWMLRIDDEGAYLGYGVCTSGESPLDGRAVHMKSGCNSFSP